jgi:unsaturated chondroitin disaccharide hydrolase
MPSWTDRINAVYDFAANQLDTLLENHPDSFPMYTREGKWCLEGETWTNWCEGFLAGQLWLLYQHTRQDEWRARAEHYSLLIEPRKTDRLVHDLGFLFLPTWKRWYDLTGDTRQKQVVIQAGQTLALRFNRVGRYLRSFLAEDSLFIDIMMNVGIIFYAAQQTGDAELENIARQHCLTTRRCLVRGDGSSAHEGIFDLETGQFLRQSTQQGWRSDSCWARGLAWALYGFSTVYEMTGDGRFLETAEACAHYYIDHTPEHGVPPNDWDEPHPKYPYESSAAAIAAGGLLNLAHLSGDWGSRRLYRQVAMRILDTLMSPEFLASSIPGWEGILKHGIYHQRKGLGVDESVMWGDYFFLEALSKVKDG